MVLAHVAVQQYKPKDTQVMEQVVDGREGGDVQRPVMGGGAEGAAVTPGPKAGEPETRGEGGGGVEEGAKEEGGGDAGAGQVAHGLMGGRAFIVRVIVKRQRAGV